MGVPIPSSMKVARPKLVTHKHVPAAWRFRSLGYREAEKHTVETMLMFAQRSTNAAQARRSKTEKNAAKAAARAERRASKPNLIKYMSQADSVKLHFAIQTKRRHLEHVDDIRRRERDLFENGFHREAGYFHGAYLPALCELELRSAEDDIMKRVAHAFTAKGRIRTGMTKAELRSSDSKLIALYDPWGELTPEMRCLIPVDIDSITNREELLAKIAALGLPIPNFSTGHESTRGDSINPTLGWLLPFDSVVCVDKRDPRYNANHHRLFRDVARGITKQLQSLGADQNGVCNLGHIKDPLSPYWTTHTYPSVQLTLTEWARVLKLDQSPKKAWEERQAEAQEMEEELLLGSNALFRFAGRVSFRILQTAYRERDPEYVGRASIEEFLYPRLLRELVQRTDLEGEVLAEATRKSCVHWEVEWDDTRQESGVRRGRDAELRVGLSENECKRLSAERTNAAKKEERDRVFAVAMDVLHRDRQQINKDTLAAATGKSARTAGRWLAQPRVQSACFLIDIQFDGDENFQSLLASPNCHSPKAPEPAPEPLKEEKREGSRQRAKTPPTTFPFHHRPMPLPADIFFAQPSQPLHCKKVMIRDRSDKGSEPVEAGPLKSSWSPTMPIEIPKGPRRPSMSVEQFRDRQEVHTVAGDPSPMEMISAPETVKDPPGGLREVENAIGQAMRHDLENDQLWRSQEDQGPALIKHVPDDEGEADPDLLALNRIAEGRDDDDEPQWSLGNLQAHETASLKVEEVEIVDEIPDFLFETPLPPKPQNTYEDPYVVTLEAARIAEARKSALTKLRDTMNGEDERRRNAWYNRGIDLTGYTDPRSTSSSR